MRGVRFGSLLSLVRQGLAVEVEFGTRSVEALLWVAEAVEESVYAPGSLVSVPGGFRFLLHNPPLRVGGFRAVRLLADGVPVEPACLRLRLGDARTTTTAAEVAGGAPLELAPGRSLEVTATGAERPVGARVRVRLELESVAIPPLVWLEFEDELREGAA